MRKTRIWLIIIILVAAWILYVVWGRNDFALELPTRSDWWVSKVFAEHIPDAYDQLVYLRFDNDLKEIARETNNFIDDQTFWVMIETLQSVVVFQWMNWQMPVSLIFFQWTSEFSIDQVETFGLLATWSEYEYIELDENMWVYWDITSLNWFEEYAWGVIDNTPGWEAFTSELSRDHNAWFLSSSLSQDAADLWWWAIVSQFSSLLEYTYVVSSMRKEKPQWKVVLQLADQTLTGPVTTLQPEILSSLWGNPLMYLEADNLLWLLSLERSELETMLPMVLWQRWTQQGVVFSNADTNRLLDALEGNIAIVALPSPMSPLQLSLHVIFDDPEMFTLLEKLTPLVESTAWPLLFGSWAAWFEKNTMANTITYSLPLGWEGMFDAWDAPWAGIEDLPNAPSSLPIFSLNRSSDFASIDLFSVESAFSDSTWWADLIDSVTIPDNTKILFWWDSWLMKDSVLGWLWVDTWDSLFSTWSLQWSLSVHPDQQQVQIDFIVE